MSNKHRLWYRAGLYIFCLVVTGGLLAPSVQSAKPASKGGGGGGTTGEQDVYLTLTVEDFDGSGNPTKIRSDGLGNDGTYENGVDGVCANFDYRGDLIIDFACKHSSTRRNLIISADEPLVPYLIDTPLGTVPPPISNDPSLPSYTSFVSTVGPTPDTGDPIQTMAVGASQCIQVNVRYLYEDQAQTMFRLAYHRVQANPAYPDILTTPYGVITRVSDTEWTLDPGFNAKAPCNMGEIDSYSGTRAAPAIVTTPFKGPFDFQDAGTWVIPFRFTLNTQQ